MWGGSLKVAGPGKPKGSLGEGVGGEKMAKYGSFGGFLTDISSRSRSTEKLGLKHVGGWSSRCPFALEWTSLAWREEPVVLRTLKGSSVAADGGLWLRITAVRDGFAGPWDARPWNCRLSNDLEGTQCWQLNLLLVVGWVVGVELGIGDGGVVGWMRCWGLGALGGGVFGLSGEDEDGGVVLVWCGIGWLWGGWGKEGCRRRRNFWVFFEVVGGRVAQGDVLGKKNF